MNWVLIFSNALYTAISANAIGYCLIAIGLNVHFGYTGLLNFGQAGFAAVGAYGVAIPIADYGWSLVCGPAARASSARSCSPCSSASRRCGCAPTTWPSSPSRPPRSSGCLLNSTRFTWLTGGNDGLQNGCTGFFEDLNPFDNTGRYKLGAQSFDGYRPVHHDRRLDARRPDRRCSSGR